MIMLPERKLSNIYRVLIQVLLLLLCAKPSVAQDQKVKDLEQKIYKLNNDFMYEQSIREIRSFLRDAKDNDERYYGFLFLSYTYQRLYDNPAALQLLDTAYAYGQRSDRKEYYANNIACQKAFVLSNMAAYKAADSILKLTAANNYKDITREDLAKVFVLEGSSDVRKKDFVRAEQKYDAAMQIVRATNPCDQAMVYGNQIRLFAAKGDRERMEEAFRKAIAVADSCGIMKSKSFAHQVLIRSYEEMGDYKSAYEYLRKLNGLSAAYDRNAHLAQITALDKKFQTQEKEAKLLRLDRQIQRKNLFIVVLVGSLIVTIVLVLLGFLIRRNKRQRREDVLRRQFTKQLLQNSEQERSRIAGELHDGISHDLLTLKNSLQQGVDVSSGKIDRIINDIRQISRNLHPVMLDKIGLKPSIEHLCERYMHDERLFVTADISYDKQLNADGELQLYRIIQEALTNIDKHAGAHAAQIAIDTRPDVLKVCIKDNGRGFDTADVLSGGAAFGLHSIIERSKAMGGTASLISGETGTTIDIEIPLKHE